MNVSQLQLVPVKELKEFTKKYGIQGHFNEKHELINAIKGPLDENYYRNNYKMMLKDQHEAYLQSKNHEKKENLFQFIKNVFSQESSPIPERSRRPYSTTPAQSTPPSTSHTPDTPTHENIPQTPVEPINVPSNAEPSTSEPIVEGIPTIVIENDILPQREERPYAFSKSVPKESMQSVSLISIMANKIPLDSLSTKTLRMLLLEERVSTAGIIERQDLIDKVKLLISNVRGEINNLDNDEELCRICVDNVINCVLLECGHYVLCLECAEQIKKSTKECPICRQVITRIVHTFRS